MEGLTPREMELANLVAAGFSNQQISDILAIRRQTVKNHIQTIYKKLKIHNRVELSLHLAGKDVEDMKFRFLCSRELRSSPVPDRTLPVRSNR
jgi:DNA-binding CsgD family transcriptional regulator